MLELIHPHVLDSILKYVPGTSREAVIEFMRFMLLSAQMKAAISGANRFIPVTPLIDAIWHHYILQTREYAEFCSRLAPGCFIHHRTIPWSEHRDDVTSLQRLHQEDLSWIASYVANFGGFTADTVQYWRVPSLLLKDRGWELEQLHELARELIAAAEADS